MTGGNGLIKESIEQVRKNIEDACKRVGRDPSEVTLICVSKTKPDEAVMEAYEAGERVFGENKVQELTGKMERLPKDIHWHLIGHLQRNKVKYIIGKVDLIHSVDSFRLAEEINIRAKKANIIQPVLIEINIGEEESKFGIRLEDTKELIRAISQLDAVKVSGLMCIAPYVVDPEENRELFHQIKDLAIDIRKEKIHNVDMGILSMGMTNDYLIAVEEGSTMVRVGTAIFGERSYNKGV